MLDMFKRPTDPPEYYHLYGIPSAGAMAIYGAGAMSGKFPELDAAAGTLSGILCIGGIGGLSSQNTARLGAVSGQAGVAMGVAGNEKIDRIYDKRGNFFFRKWSFVNLHFGIINASYRLMLFVISVYQYFIILSHPKK